MNSFMNHDIGMALVFNLSFHFENPLDDFNNVL